MNSAIKKNKLSMKLKVRTDKITTFPIKSSSKIPSTPYSPISPTPSTTNEPDPISIESNFPIIKNQYSLQSSLKCKGYMSFHQLSRTLQGSIWKVLSNNGSKYIVKVTDKALHNQSIAQFKGKKIPIYENILKEIKILHRFAKKNPPKSLIKYIDCFHDKYNYFLVMEDGGIGLFDFIKDCHQYITKGFIHINEWHKFCKLAMKQMIDALNWLHNQNNCAHLDVSLENFTIQNIQTAVIMDNKQKKIVFSSNFQIKLIDFGLAEVFRSNNEGQPDYRCSKFVGKIPYQSPEICNKKKGFNAASADCWSLAVCFFMMFFGGQPFTKATSKDDVFKLVMKGQIIDVLESWNLIKYVSVEMLDLLNRLFCYERHRLTSNQIKNHCFFD